MPRVSKVHLEKRLMPNGRTTLRLYWEIDGKRHHESLGLYLEPGRKRDVGGLNDATLRIAEDRRREKEEALFSNPDDLGPVHGRRTPFLSFYDTVAAGKRNVTWVTLKKHLQSYLDGTTPRLADITPQWIESFKAFLITHLKLSNNTTEKYLAHLNTAMKLAYKQRIITSNPFDRVERLKVRQTKRVFLTQNELESLVKAPCVNEETKRAFLFACSTGLRFSDVHALQWQDISDDILSYRQQKTKTVQHLPLNPTAMALLGPRSDSGGDVFHLPNRNYMNKVLKRWAMSARIMKNISFHTARHTYATMMLARGADVYFVMRYLGHQNLQTTELYLDMAAETMREKSNLFPNLVEIIAPSDPSSAEIEAADHSGGKTS